MTSRTDAKNAQYDLFPSDQWPQSPGPTLPEICLDVRASTDGSADPWPRERLERVRDMLVATVATWDKGRGDIIDACIQTMCGATVHIISQELAQREKDHWHY